MKAVCCSCGAYEYAPQNDLIRDGWRFVTASVECKTCLAITKRIWCPKCGSIAKVKRFLEDVCGWKK